MNATNIGIDDAGTDSVVTNIQGKTVNLKANTANTKVNSAYTSAATATEVINNDNVTITSLTATVTTANINIATANETIGQANLNIDDTILSGNTLSIKEAGGFTYSGGGLTSSVVNDTEINSGRDTKINTTGATTVASTGNTTIETKGANNNVTINSSGNGGDVNVYAKDVLTETANTMVLSATTSISAKTPTTYVSGTTLEVKENNINLSAATGTNISGGTFTSTTTGNTNINSSGNTNVNTNGNTVLTSTGSTTIQSTAGGSNVNIYAGSAATATLTAKTIDINGSTTSTVKAPTNNISGTTTNVFGNTNLNATGATVTISGSTASTVKAPTATLSGNTTNVYGAASLNMTGTSVNTTGGTVNVSGGTGGVNITGNTKVNGNLTVTGTTTLAATTATTISASTSVTTPLISATTISADVIHTESGLENPLSWSYGSVSNATAGSYNASGATAFTIPQTISDVASGKVSSDASGNLSVSGTITATGAIYSSDINLKENVQNVDYHIYANANGVAIRKFNFRNDESKRTMYGVIAQEVEIAGLEDIVVVKEDGFKGVDYTALSLLKIAYLENKVKELEALIKKLTEEKQ